MSCLKHKVNFVFEQVMVIEFARNVLGFKDANSTEFDKETQNPVIHIIDTQKGLEETGGTMRLGGYRCRLLKNSKASKIYTEELIVERHRHRYEFNDLYKKDLEKHGFIASGICPDISTKSLSGQIPLAIKPCFSKSFLYKSLNSYLCLCRSTINSSV
jgi:CTP synthase (UTP-ammonia lyase)